MSAEKEKLNQLVEKIDELLSVLKDVSDDLKTVSASVKSLAVSQITAKPSAPTAAPKTPSHPTREATEPSPATPAKPGEEKAQSVEDLRMMFPEDLDNMLSFEEKGEFVVIKPKQFLGSENFAKIASTVRGMGGEYISAGRDSHFRVYKKKP